MKIRIEITDNSEDEIIIRTSELSDTVKRIEKAVKEITAGSSTMAFYKDGTKYYLELRNILFFETSENGVCAHTAKECYGTEFKLYELEEILPSYFMRVSKSTILNTEMVYSISRNITASSLVEFQNTYKKVYVSRNYYKALIFKIEEKRLSKLKNICGKTYFGEYFSLPELHLLFLPLQAL